MILPLMEQEVLLCYRPRNKPSNAAAHSLTRDLPIWSGFVSSASILTLIFLATELYPLLPLYFHLQRRGGARGRSSSLAATGSRTHCAPPDLTGKVYNIDIRLD